jgi:hypothetical protein
MLVQLLDLEEELKRGYPSLECAEDGIEAALLDLAPDFQVFNHSQVSCM